MAMYSPKPGDIGIIRSKGIPARLIQFGTLSRWNHVFIYVGNDRIIEANPKGVQLNLVGSYYGPKIVWNKHQPWINEDVQRKQIVAGAFAALNEPYNWTNILRFVLRSLGLGIFANTKLMKYLAKKDGYICSELAEELYTKAGNSFTHQEPGATSPGDIIMAVIYQ